MNLIKNIIIINDSAFIKGGAEKVALNSAIELSKRGINVILFSSIGPIDSKLINAGIKVICLQQYDILNDPSRLRAIKQGLWNNKALNKLREILKQYSPSDTIIHFHSWTKALSPSIFSATAKYKFKIVITTHDYFLACPNGGFFNYRSKQICNISSLSYKCLTCNCDSRNYPQKIWRSIRQYIQNKTLSKNQINIIFISSLIKNILSPYLNPIANKTYHLNNPIELSPNVISNIEKNDLYLFVGRLSPEKGCELFCQAITDLGLKGCVVGDGYMRTYLQKKYPSIKFTGWLTGKAKDNIIQKGKALVFPSLWYEGAPLTIMEMKSYGIPCIVPDRSAAKEEIIDGKTGLIFQSGNIDSLKKCIQLYEKTKITELHNNIIQSFSTKDYSIETHVSNLLSIYNDILK